MSHSEESKEKKSLELKEKFRNFTFQHDTFADEMYKSCIDLEKRRITKGLAHVINMFFKDCFHEEILHNEEIMKIMSFFQDKYGGFHSHHYCHEFDEDQQKQFALDFKNLIIDCFPLIPIHTQLFLSRALLIALKISYPAVERKWITKVEI